MPYITSIERLALKRGEEKGRVQGLQMGLAITLRARFGTAGAKLARKVREVREEKQLLALGEALERAQTLDEIRPLLP